MTQWEGSGSQLRIIIAEVRLDPDPSGLDLEVCFKTNENGINLKSFQLFSMWISNNINAALATLGRGKLLYTRLGLQHYPGFETRLHPVAINLGSDV
jgi:hypothetical protein